MPRLSTHVLDTSRGKPAQNVRIDLHRCDGGRRHIKSVATNADGRTAEPLLSGDRLETGIYELTFHAGDYFRSVGIELSDPPFLGDVVIRFGLSDPAADYHVPLLLSPYGYSTYRGS
ncbi:MAG TPA: hydroxyisourate hydrolase [Bryobacteraceae bacterium]|jgi:5-hydroxyisourate hydrolase|nr:hydroxyisourate hydrolase [Bryobacteraceae bacterium]